MSAAPDLATTALKMAGSLVLVLAIMWGLQRWARRRLPSGPSGGGLIQVLGSHYLGVKKTVTLVQVPGSILVLGVSNDRINLLTRIEDPALLAQCRQDSENRTPFSFRQHLQRLSRPMGSKQGSEPRGEATEHK